MRTQRQERQARETAARKADKAHVKALYAAGYTPAEDLIPAGCTAREVDYYHNDRKIGRALLQRDGSYGCHGVGEWGLVPPLTRIEEAVA